MIITISHTELDRPFLEEVQEFLSVDASFGILGFKFSLDLSIEQVKHYHSEDLRLENWQMRGKHWAVDPAKINDMAFNMYDWPNWYHRLFVRDKFSARPGDIPF